MFYGPIDLAAVTTMGLAQRASAKRVNPSERLEDPERAVEGWKKLKGFENRKVELVKGRNEWQVRVYTR